MQFPVRCEKACKFDTAESFSNIFYAAECENCIENQESQRQKPKWENGSTAVQGLPQRNLHNSILRKMASSEVLVLQVSKWMQNLGISALTHTARLTNSQARSLKRMVTKLQWLY